MQKNYIKLACFVVVMQGVASEGTFTMAAPVATKVVEPIVPVVTPVIQTVAAQDGWAASPTALLQQNSDFQGIQARLDTLQTDFDALLATYPAATSARAVVQNSGSWGAPSVIVQPSMDTFNYNDKFVAIKKMLMDLPTSYGASMDALFVLYNAVSAGVGAQKMLFIKAPFVSHSVLIAFLQSAVGNTLNFLKIRLKSITIQSYATSAVGLFAQQNGEVKQLNDCMMLYKKKFDTAFQSVNANADLKSEEIKLLQANYQTIFDGYEIQKNQIIMTAGLAFFKNLSKKYSLTIAANMQAESVDMALPVIASWYLPLASVLTDMITKKQKLSCSDVTDPAIALKTLQINMANFYLFAAAIAMNSIKKIVADSFKNGVLKNDKILSILATMPNQNVFTCYDNAAYFLNQSGDVNAAQIYSTMAQNVKNGVIAWQAAIKSVSLKSYENANALYQQVYEIFTQSCPELATYILNIMNTTAKDLIKQQVALYVTKGPYVRDMRNYKTAALSSIKQAVALCNAPSMTTTSKVVQDIAQDTIKALSLIMFSEQNYIANFFYNAGSADSKSLLYGGMAKLYQVASGIFKTVLTNLNFSASENVDFVKKSLQDALNFGQNFSDAAYLMLVKGFDGVSDPADKNLSAFNNVNTVLMGQKQWISILQKCAKADVFLAKKSSQSFALQSLNPFIPYGLFTTSTIETTETMYEFMALHAARLSAISSFMAYAYARSGQYPQDKYPDMEDKLLCIAVANALHAKMMYNIVRFRTKQLSAAENMVKKLLLSLKPYSAKCLEKAKALEKNAITLQDYEQLVYWSKVAHIIFKSDSYYSKILETYNAKHVSNAFNVDFPQWYSIKIAYSSYVWALSKQNAVNVQSALDQIKTGFKDLNDAVKVVQDVLNSSQSYDAKIVAGTKLQQLGDTLATFMIEQEQEAALFGIQNCKKIIVADTMISGIPGKQYTFNGSSITLPSGEFYTAQLNMQKADKLVADLQNNYEQLLYDNINEDDFVEAANAYNNAVQLYNTLDMHDASYQAQQGVTRATALDYITRIIPSNTVRSFTPELIAQQAFASKVVVSTQITPGDSSASGSLSMSSSDVSNASDIEPLYITRFWKKNLTEMAKIAGNSVAIEAYAGIINAAKLYKDTIDDSAVDVFIDTVMVPFYRQILLAAGYTPQFCSLDDDVVLYGKQLKMLAHQGIMVGGVSLKASFKVTTMSVNGVDQIIIIARNMPLAPLARFPSDVDSASFYYTIVKKLIMSYQSNHPVEIGAQFFFPVCDKPLAEKIGYASDVTYMIEALSTYRAIDILLKDVQSITNKQDAQLSNYQQKYSQFGAAYSYILALCDVVDSLQGQDNKTYIDANKKRASIYVECAEKTKLFFLGSPLALQYIALIKDCSSNYYAATQYMTDKQCIAQLYRAVGEINESAGDLCCSINKVMPQLDGYPSYAANSTKIIEQILPKNVACSTPPATYFIPPTGELKFGCYFDAQGYYQQAYFWHSEALKIANDISVSPLDDVKSRTNFCKMIISLIRAAVQEIALFGRNAIAVKYDNNGIAATSFDSDFINIIKTGITTGAISAAQGFRNLTQNASGQSGKTVNNQACYTIMQNLLLNGLLDLIAASSMISKYLTDAGITKCNEKAMKKSLNTAEQCGAGYLFPEFLVQIGEQKGLLVGVLDQSIINLIGMTTLEAKLFLMHADSFPAWCDYVLNAVWGNASAQSQYQGAQSSSNIYAINWFVSQLTMITRLLYAQTFLSQEQDPLKREMGINTALKNAQQALIVNPAGYVG